MGSRTRSGGSLASARSGEPRATLDVDCVVDLPGEQLERRQRVRVADRPERFLYFHSPEDILLQKLHWYRLGGGVSDRQWRDVLSIVLAQGDGLDRSYLEGVARSTGLSDLLERALGMNRPAS